jgi:BlaI family penicillinase repressor
MAAPKPEKLTRREREIMDALFAAPEGASAEDVRSRLMDPPSYSAVRTMLVRLEDKGYVKHREAGLRYIYVPTTPRSAARRTALQQLVRVFFAGSPVQTATELLKHEQWTDEELAALGKEIEAVRHGRKRS